MGKIFVLWQKGLFVDVLNFMGIIFVFESMWVSKIVLWNFHGLDAYHEINTPWNLISIQ